MRPSVFHQSKRNCRRPPESLAGKGQTRRRALKQHTVTNAEDHATDAAAKAKSLADAAPKDPSDKKSTATSDG
jgi:hypothetical protein